MQLVSALLPVFYYKALLGTMFILLLSLEVSHYDWSDLSFVIHNQKYWESLLSLLSSLGFWEIYSVIFI